VTADLPLWLVVLIAGLLGAVIGSFLNVCILRWPADQSVVRPPSRCPRCGAGLRPWDNIPILSWIILRARCRSCGEPISAMYPLVELATALIWAGMAWRHGLTLEALSGAVFFTILLGIAMTDARTYLIPDEFTLGGLVIGLLFAVPDGIPGLGHALLGAVVGFGVLWLVGAVGTWIFRKDAMGGGDIKMMAMVGAFLGWQGVLLTIFLGALLGTLIFVPISLIKRGKLVPFGIFLSLGAAATALAGPAIIAWYRTSVLGW
jgi:leader peptidase (prepilin peptidase)/N-methyltransferase